jgi:hypothetical protein
MFAPHGPTLHTGFPPFRNEREMVGQPFLKREKINANPKGGGQECPPRTDLHSTPGSHPFATNAKWWGSLFSNGKNQRQPQKRRTRMSAPHGLFPVECSLRWGGVIA